jgi:O-antigen ligase
MTSLRNFGVRFCAAMAAALFLLLLLSLARVDQVPAYVVIGLGALTAVAAIRPDNGLVALAMGVPFAVWLGRQWNPSVAWGEALAVAFCAGYSLRGMVRQPTSSNGRYDVASWSNGRYDALHFPFLLAIAVILASLAVQLLIDAWRFGASAMAGDLGILVASGYFVTSVSSDPVDATMRLLESLIVFRATVSVTRQTPAFAGRLLAWTVAGACAAAGLNLLRLWEAAARLEQPFAWFVNYFMTERLNVHYSDFNAAGSYFVLTLFVALGLMLARGPAPRGTWRRHSAWWAIAVLLIGSSIWISGSRTAMIAGLLALLIPAGAQAMRIRRNRVRGTTVAVAAVALAILAGVAAYALPERGNQRSALAALQVRVELARTSLSMAATSPAFGVGIGRYYSRSGEFASAKLLTLFPPAIHENAHNNFLQILAELGIVGFLAMGWLLLTAARLGAQLLRADPRDPVRWCLVTGLSAFVLSCLGGHPLLIDEPAFSFWLLLGVVCGWGATIAMSPPTRPTTWIVSGMVVAIALSVPLRVARQRADFNLEHRGVGLSAWQDAIDGIRYRLAGSRSSVFLPADSQMIVVPLRSVSPAGEIRVQLTLDGRPADVVKVTADRWRQLRLRMPQDRRSPRFRRLDLQTDDIPSGGAPILMIGKVEPR